MKKNETKTNAAPAPETLEAALVVIGELRQTIADNETEIAKQTEENNQLKSHLGTLEEKAEKLDQALDEANEMLTEKDAELVKMGNLISQLEQSNATSGSGKPQILLDGKLYQVRTGARLHGSRNYSAAEIAANEKVAAEILAVDGQQVLIEVSDKEEKED